VRHIGRKADRATRAEEDLLTLRKSTCYCPYWAVDLQVEEGLVALVHQGMRSGGPRRRAVPVGREEEEEHRYDAPTAVAAGEDGGGIFRFTAAAVPMDDAL